MRAARVLGPPLGLAAAVGLAGCFTLPAPGSRPPAPPAAPPPNAPPPTAPQSAPNGVSNGVPYGMPYGMPYGAPYDVPDAVPRVEPKSRYGNPPFYDVFGRRYYVRDSGAGYVERGVASWYGPGFHKIRTSSGEPYDMFGMTAAHRTLPLPAYVRVTNLQNGRSIVVRVNDRGPFVGNRIIDLSYSAAYRLDMLRDGTAMVEVRALDPVLPLDAVAARGSAAALDAAAAQMAAAPPQGASAMTATALPQGPATASEPPMPRGTSPLSPPRMAPSTSPLIAEAIPQNKSDMPQGAAAAAYASATATAPGPQVAKLFVQAGAFADPANATRLAAKLQSGGYGTIFVRDDMVAGRRMYRVRIGPVPDVPEFDRIVGALEQAGVHDARLAMD